MSAPPRALRALRHRNFRLFLAGQIVSLAGTWAQQVALGWLVYRLTDSAFLLGLVGFCGQIPILLVSPFAGVWADRADRRRVVLATQAGGMVQAFLLAGLVLCGHVTPAWVLALSLAAGIVNGIDVPTRQALMAEMVSDKEDLPNAIALNSSAFNAARLVGPALGGVLVASVGEGIVFLLNAVSYVVVLAALLGVKVPRRLPAADVRNVRRELAEGLRYALHAPGLRPVLLLSALLSIVGLPFTVFLPVVATDVLQGGPRLLGVLSGCVGFGSTVAALHLAHREGVRGLDGIIRGGGVLLGLSLLALGAAHHAPVAAACAFLAGLGLTSARAASNTALQTLLDEHMRGRVMSLYAVAFLGMAPLGSLAGGVLAERIGVPLTIATGGLGTLLATAWFWRALPRFAGTPRAPEAAL